MKPLLFFAPLLFFFACKSDQVIGNLSKLPDAEKNISSSAPDTLHTLVDDFGNNFYMIGSDIGSIKILGVEHEEFQLKVSNATLPTYDYFWEKYFDQQTTVIPAKLKLAMELEPSDVKQKSIEIGSIVNVSEPKFLLSDYLYKKGVSIIVPTDTRIHTDEFFNTMLQADQLFSARGGVLATDTILDPLGFPRPIVSQYPELTAADIFFLKNIWYPQVYLEDKKFEEKVFSFLKKGNTIGIIGAGHAYSIAKRHNVPTVLVCSLKQLHMVAMRIAVHNIYLKAINVISF